MANDMIFISYSRRDNDFVNHLTDDLKAAQFNIWLDRESLVHGTPSWERAIRDAIKSAAAVILVASPDALQSDYVQGELTVAKLLNRPIYPIWANGENWIDCVPLDMANYQYVDGRGDKYSSAKEALIKTLSTILDSSEGKITLGLPTHETVELNLAQFGNAQDIMNFIYLSYLQGWYQPFTYSIDWILGNVHSKQLALTSEMAKIGRADEESVYRSLQLARSISYQDFGIKANSYWAVWDATRIRKALVALHDTSLKDLILSEGGERHLHKLHEERRLTVKPIAEANFENYPTQFVMAVFQTSKNNVAYLEV